MADLAAPRLGHEPPTVVDATVGAECAPATPYAASVGSVGSVHAGTLLDGRYRLEELIGLGGTADVYRGTDTLLDRPIAVKIFHGHLTDDTVIARQRQEMQIVARLGHPNLILLHDARNGADGPSYLVLEFVPGPTLSRRIGQGPLDPVEVAGIGVGIARALEAVHANGLVHRDVKPGNILLDADGGAKLSDFGIARVLAAERVTHSADVVGTAPYMSPEQARGDGVGPASDVYALGLVLLEALTGRREFPGAAVEAAVARLLRDPVIPDGLPPGWPPLLRRMTSFRPDDRPSASAVAVDLTTLRDGDASGAAAGSGARRRSRGAVLAGTGVAAAVLAVAATIGVLSTDDGTPPGAVPVVGPGAVASVGTSDAGLPVAGQPDAGRPAAGSGGGTSAGAIGAAVQQAGRQERAGTRTAPPTAPPRTTPPNTTVAPTTDAARAETATVRSAAAEVAAADAPTAEPSRQRDPAPGRQGTARAPAPPPKSTGTGNGSGNGRGKPKDHPGTDH